MSINWIPSIQSKSYLQDDLVGEFSIHDIDMFGIPVGGDLDLQLRGLLNSVDNGSVLVGGLYILSDCPSGEFLRLVLEFVHLRPIQCLFSLG